MTLLKKCKGKAIIKKNRKGGAPKETATCYTIGHKKKGTNGKWFKVVKFGKSRRWQELKSKKSQKSKRIKKSP